ncbi:MAG TPA: hypothetical protein VNO23_08740 [Candidatus Binatia bacterium]|nr:hypothetical protein [Candidatus Binatia bacterium]
MSLAKRPRRLRSIVWFGLLLGALGLLLPPSSAGETKRIFCPGATLISLNWKDHIGNDPTFTVKSGTQFLQPQLTSIHWAGGQVITCNYAISGVVSGVYAYTVKRRILSCRNIPATTASPIPSLECHLID